LEVRLSRARNAYLQQQMNPHLLFNALNFVYSRVLETNADAGRCLVLLTDILRFSLDGAGPDGKCSLEEESSQLESLLEINRFRFDGSMLIDMKMEGDFAAYRIPPLILLTLLENVFKHGDLSRQDAPGYVRLTVSSGGELHFFSRNIRKPQGQPPCRTGTGLENIRIRLAHAYPAGRFELKTEESETDFLVDLTVML
jgi:two-component system LytT family sensor kinase